MSLRSEQRSAVVGLMGILTLCVALALAVKIDDLPWVGIGGKNLSVQFPDAGGIGPGDPVLVSGMEVGEVRSVRIAGKHVDVGVAVTDENVVLGQGTTAALVTTTVLGNAAVKFESQGAGQLSDGATIPLSRTSSPYDVTSALADLTTTVGEIDTDKLAESLNTVADTFSDTPEVLQSALTGVERISNTISSRDEELRQLFASSSSVSVILADRNDQVTRLLKDGRRLLAELNDRREVVETLFRNVTAVSEEVQTLINGSGARLGPALRELNRFADQLNANRKKLQQTIEGLNGYVAGLGDAVSSGPYFDGYIVNLTQPASLVPILSEILSGPPAGGTP